MPEASSSELEKVAQSFRSFQPIPGKEGLWPLWGLKQVAVLCVPSWGAGQGGCHGNCPSASEERRELWPLRLCLAPLFFAERDLAISREILSGLLHHLPKVSGAQVRADCTNDAGRVLHVDSRQVLEMTSAILVSSIWELHPTSPPVKAFQEVHQCK